MPDKIPTPREMANAHPKHGGLMNEWGMQRRATYMEGIEAERSRAAARLTWLEVWSKKARSDLDYLAHVMAMDEDPDELGLRERMAQYDAEERPDA